MLTAPIAPEPAPAPALLLRLREAWARPRGHLPMVGAGACLALLGLAFREPLWNFLWVWSTDENYSHGFLVPLIALYFANEAAKRGPIGYRSGLGLGVVLLVLAFAGLLATVLVPVMLVADLALLVGLAGVIALVAGRSALRRFGFAVGFLLFMVPLPVALYAAIASPLQLMVSRVAAALLPRLGVPVLCQGNLLTLPGDVQMFVAEACSGMRQLTGFLALTTAVAYLAERPAWHRLALVASSVPIAMLANIIRVTFTGCLMYHGDPSWTTGTLHTAEGLLMMGLGLAILFAESWALDRVADLLADATRPAPALSEGAKA